jgi:hypothetical protein
LLVFLSSYFEFIIRATVRASLDNVRTNELFVFTSLFRQDVLPGGSPSNYCTYFFPSRRLDKCLCFCACVNLTRVPCKESVELTFSARKCLAQLNKNIPTWGPELVWTVAENLALTEIRSRTVQPASSRYTACIIPAHI